MDIKRSVFVIMPFSDTETCTETEWSEIYENVFSPAIENCDYLCERAIPGRGSLIKAIIEKLSNSRIVLADITDRNPNVLYELGVRHSLSRRTVIVSQKADDIPSDLKGYWSIIYGIRPGQVARFKADIKRVISEIENNPDKSDSPVSDYLGRQESRDYKRIEEGLGDRPEQKGRETRKGSKEWTIKELLHLSLNALRVLLYIYKEDRAVGTEELKRVLKSKPRAISGVMSTFTQKHNVSGYELIVEFAYRQGKQRFYRIPEDMRSKYSEVIKLASEKAPQKLNR